ncbi:phage terminase small subunit P27 family [Paramagnetospirillum kuznetsovii]|uniref:Phage terminase small subunit P27 family n=1 Tax=Paramagnetospirillum kuznetsovii TaxID=2053833 RepID=A0A364NT35_9PROT|nr:phage terminase small subunit P27 family [Paramagnetospirillum kuznetsovii]RAU20075.1 phage terminase small subunit P27 family [Paramagnetospirillum kuznetsovii]
MRGTMPKSAELHQLHGTTRKTSKARATAARTVAVPTPDDVLTPPEYLEGVALAEWNRLAPELKSRNMFTVLDRNTLATYVTTWALYLEAVAALKETGVAIKTGVRSKKTSPHALVVETSSRALSRLSGELGLNFLSRARLGIQEKADYSGGEFADF